MPAENSLSDPPDTPLGAENDWLQNEGVDAGLENHPFRPADTVFVVIQIFDSPGKAGPGQVASVSKPGA